VTARACIKRLTQIFIKVNERASEVAVITKTTATTIQSQQQRNDNSGSDVNHAAKATAISSGF